MTTEQDFLDYLRLEMRCARLRAQLLVNDVDAIGLAFSIGLITGDEAIAHLENSGVLRIVGSPPPSTPDKVAS